MNVVVFEDDGVHNLHPITLSRPAYAISCAGYRLIDFLLQMDGNLVGVVRPFLSQIQAHDYPDLAPQLDSSFLWTLVVNARVAPTVANLRCLERIMGDRLTDSNADEIRVIETGHRLAAAVVPTRMLIPTGIDSGPAPATQQITLPQILQIPTLPSVQRAEGSIRLLDYPHCVVSENLKCFDENLAYRLSQRDYRQPQPGVFFGDQVQVHEQVVFDTTQGPVIIDDRVKIGPFSFFRGPVYVGPDTKISEHASIKDSVSVSHTCKIGGEVEGTILEPYTNKQHHGFLGHSYLGSWINLGAGTCNSDLKNTYGTVNMEYHGQKVSTGLQFVGCVVGDYAKTAINTSIFTGKTIGVASMVYGFATTNVPSFVNYARTFGEFGSLPPEVIVTTQQRMFARRNVRQRPCDIQLLHDIYRLTEDERPQGLSSKPLSL